MSTGDLASLQARVQGRVQGVFFRDFVRMNARRLGLMGYVRNLPDGTVEVRAEGEKDGLEKLVEVLHSGPPYARVEKVLTHWSKHTGHYTDFTVEF